MKKEDYLKIALCGSSMVSIYLMKCLYKERKEIKDVLAKQNQAIKILSEQVDNLNFVSETTEKGMVYLVNRRQPHRLFFLRENYMGLYEERDNYVKI